MKFTKSRSLQVALILYTIILIASCIYNLYHVLLHDPTFIKDTTGFCSDWLINYEGGFVRRGLIGQILYYIYTLVPYDVMFAVLIITYASTILFAALMFYLFYKNKLSWPLLLMPFMLGGFLLFNATIYRRDALMLLMIFLVIYLYRKYLTATAHRTTQLLLLYASGIISILTHEAAFFCFVPFVLLHYYTVTSGTTAMKKIVKSLLFSSPFILSMAAVCLFKGNPHVSGAIWESWHPYLESQYGQIPPMGAAVKALEWETLDTFRLHFRINFLNPITCDKPNFALFLHNIPCAIPWFFIFIGVYYLCINVNRLKIFPYEDGSNDTQINALLPQILLIQFIGHLPMFTVLSCDTRRVMFYCIFSSFFILSQFLATKQTLTIPHITPLSNKLSSLLRGDRSRTATAVFVFVFLFLGVPYGSFTVNEYIGSTVIFRIYFTIRYSLLSLIL